MATGIPARALMAAPIRFARVSDNLASGRQQDWPAGKRRYLVHFSTGDAAMRFYDEPLEPGSIVESGRYEGSAGGASEPGRGLARYIPRARARVRPRDSRLTGPANRPTHIATLAGEGLLRSPV
jgi:hypothetical protein